MKRALVLPGGGGRGAYQVGVAKALAELGIEFDMILGTSIGALNAAFLVQGDLERLENIWCSIRMTDIFRLPSAAQLSSMILGTKLGLLDTAPLEAILRREVDLKKLKASKTTVGLVTTDLCSLETRLITIDDIASTEELIDILMATSAVPVAFPPRQLEGHGLWVDGGLVKNTPVQAAVDRGAEEIFVVLLHPERITACPTNMLQLIARCLDIVLDASARKEIEVMEVYNRLLAEGAKEAAGHRRIDIRLIQPRKPVDTTLLDVSPRMSRALIQEGYEDALAALFDRYGQPAAASTDQVQY